MKQNIPFKVSNVEAGTTASVTLLKGNLIHRVNVQLAINGKKATDAQFLKVVERVKILFDGNTEWDISAETFLKLNKRYKLNDSNDGIFCIYFSRIELQEHADTNHLGIGLKDIDVAKITFDFSNTLDGNTYVPSMKAFGYCTPDPNKEHGTGRYLRIVETDYNGLAGQNNIDELTSIFNKKGVWVKAVHFENADIEEVAIKVGQVELFKADTVLNKKINKDNTRTVGGVLEQSNWFSIDHSGADLEESNVYEGASTVTHKVKLSQNASSTKIGIVYEILVV